MCRLWIHYSLLNTTENLTFTEAQNTTWERSWTTPCHSYNYISSSINRLVNYTLQPGEQEYCDSYHGYYMGMNDIDMEQWYRFGTSENLLTWSPSQLQCGSRSPIWVDGKLFIYLVKSLSASTKKYIGLRELKVFDYYHSCTPPSKACSDPMVCFPILPFFPLFVWLWTS